MGEKFKMAYIYSDDQDAIENLRISMYNWLSLEIEPLE